MYEFVYFHTFGGRHTSILYDIIRLNTLNVRKRTKSSDWEAIGMAVKNEVNVEPLRTRQEIEDFKDALKLTGGQRDLMLFTIGINTGLRIGDILALKVSDVRGRDTAVIIEQKTGKKRTLYLRNIADEIDAYTRFMDEGDYLFSSRKKDADGRSKAISTTQAYRALQKAADLLERGDIGTHTMRKTFGYQHYQRNKDIAILMVILNHSSPSVTKRYIGIRQDEITSTLIDFRL